MVHFYTHLHNHFLFMYFHYYLFYRFLLSKQANQFFSTMSKVDIKDFTIPNEQPVVNLDCNSAFKNLTGKERLYAHHLSRASFYGGLVVLVQVIILQSLNEIVVIFIV